MTIEVPLARRRTPAAAPFDLFAIRLAVMCARLGSLTAACESMHCSLPAGSQRLSALERALGARLFLRARRGLHPTAAGKRFLQLAPGILHELNCICEMFSKPEDVTF